VVRRFELYPRRRTISSRYRPSGGSGARSARAERISACGVSGL